MNSVSNRGFGLYSPSSNGVAERLFTNGIHTMLRDSNLPARFWTEAMGTRDNTV